jgi:hypothetical protein
VFEGRQVGAWIHPRRWPSMGLVSVPTTFRGDRTQARRVTDRRGRNAK